jgi:hypothetical protein
MEAHVNSTAIRHPGDTLIARALRRTADALEWMAGLLRARAHPTASLYTHAGSMREEGQLPPGVLGPEQAAQTDSGRTRKKPTAA